jgi:hypothetical protein
MTGSRNTLRRYSGAQLINGLSAYLNADEDALGDYESRAANADKTIRTVRPR